MENINQPQTEIKVILFSLQHHALHVLVHTQSSDDWEYFPSKDIQSELSLEGSALACLKNFLPAEEIYLEQLYTYGDEIDGGNQRLISIVYYALLPNNKTELSSNQAKWIPVQQNNHFSDNDKEILAYALRRLRYKLEYTAVGFELLPDTFSLSELQKTYEIILNEKLDKRNFRRRILQANIIEPTPYRKTGEGRPATLYQYRSDAVAEVKIRRLFP
jgi:8-oxo-dGTP diphosphatase